MDLIASWQAFGLVYPLNPSFSGDQPCSQSLPQDTAYNESLDAVFTSPGSYGIHFADSDTPSLLVVGVVPASPAENQAPRSLAVLSVSHVVARFPVPSQVAQAVVLGLIGTWQRRLQVLRGEPCMGCKVSQTAQAAQSHRRSWALSWRPRKSSETPPSFL